MSGPDPAQVLVVRGDPTSEELAALVVALLVVTDGASRGGESSTAPASSWASIEVGTAAWQGPAAWSVPAEPWRAVG